MKTIKQLVKEFWLPFLVATAWTSLNYYGSPQGQSIADIVKSFSASFFLISWATGQFVRVSRQARTDEGLATVEARTTEIINNLDGAANRLLSTITGGDSFAYVSMSEVSDNIFSPVILHEGEYPLANLSVRICDLRLFHEDIQAGRPFDSDTNLNIGDVAPRLATMTGVTVPISSPQQDWNIFFSARNGLWTQRIRGRVLNGKWKFADVVTREEDGKTTLLKVSVPYGFPKIGEADFDGAERSNLPQN